MQRQATTLVTLQQNWIQCTGPAAKSTYFGWAPGHGEEHVEGHPQLLCAVDVAVGWGVGYDRLQSSAMLNRSQL